MFSPQLHGQHQMQFSQPMAHQQFQGRQLSSGHVQHSIGQNQLNQGNQMNRHLSQFSSAANSALYNAAQATSNSQMVRYTSPLLIHFPFIIFMLCNMS
jgi:predicted PurR-regulated permease PerM